MSGAILVTGGTGELGHEVVRLLAECGRELRVLSRRDRPGGAGCAVDWHVGDLGTGDGLDAALAGAGTVVHCATTAGRADVAATRRLTAAAHRAGVRHLVYISIVGIERASAFPYYRAKLTCERIVVRSGLPWTVLRATQFHTLVARFALAQRRLPLALTLGGVPLQPVDAKEVAGRLAELVRGAPAGRVPDMGGPQVRTLDEMTRTALAADGNHRPVVPLRLPGKLFRALRAGALLAPDAAVGRVTFDDFLAAR
ncbi:SDR family oxidoreductase [Streptomyces sp. RFCAC02]|uniref:SDR family oxidoreductase n=1 Tax=Streptomyces sp. RFCAC02 TaxID=2499143 RepID=UPI00101FFFA8|nr:SDR family oxidoreductase [Streptomyces sp. RFCAC02]